MTVPNMPQPGEIWVTTDLLHGDACTERRSGGWHWLPSGERCGVQDRRQLRLLGYTAEYVDNLRSDRRPQDVLREAALIVSTSGVGYSAGDCDALADELDREDAEEADRDRMIEAAARVLLGEDSWAETTPQAREDALWEAAALYDAGMLCEAVNADAAFAEQTRLEREAAEKLRRDRIVEAAARVICTTRDHWPDKAVSPQDWQMAENLRDAGLLVEAVDQ